MTKYTILVGNDINNIADNNSWKKLVNDIAEFCGTHCSDTKTKPFPMLYEEIFLKSLKVKYRKENSLKNFIAERVSKIESNELHKRINRLAIEDIITTNYEFSLEEQIPEKNNGAVTETTYSIFRHFKVGKKRYWHIHGDCQTPNSINLGFEHYGGQLQQMRNYVVTKTNYKSKIISKLPLIRRLKNKESLGFSWIDLFFTTDIYILGLTLDFVETDLWWLLTYRARQKYYKNNSDITNKIVYFIPAEKKVVAQDKIDLFIANGVEVIDSISGIDKLQYYHKILEYIEQATV